jgi:hypothetical protein
MKARSTKAIGFAVGFLYLSGVMIAGQAKKEIYDYFRQYIGLSDGQITAVSNGTVLVKELPSSTPAEIILLGTVYVNSRPQTYMKLIRDFDALRRLPSYLAIQPFSTPPQLSDLRGFTLDSNDIDDLRVCVPGNCNVNLPAEKIEEFKDSIDWSAKDAADQVNNLAQKLALEALIAYQKGGDSALGAYQDDKNPIWISEQFQKLVAELKLLPVYLPEFRDCLLEYPKCGLPNVEDQFYWEKVKFGLKPTIRLVHAIFYPEPGGELAFVYALKQLYSSHYFRAAIDLSACAKAADRPGFFIITVKALEVDGLTGIKGAMVRKVVIGRAQTSLEGILADTKKALETSISE